MPDLVIFDNDGVLVDSEPLANRVLAGLLTEAGVPTTYDDAVATYMGGSLARVHQLVNERTGRALPADFDTRYHEQVFTAFQADLRPVPGSAELLESLSAADIPFCVASSGTHDRIRISLARVGLLRWFDDARIFSSADVPNGKPAPDLFLYAAAAMGRKPQRCVVIEDSPSGVEAARAAGMAVYGYAAMTPIDRLSGADGIVTDLAALVDLFA